MKLLMFHKLILLLISIVCSRALQTNHNGKIIKNDFIGAGGVIKMNNKLILGINSKNELSEFGDYFKYENEQLSEIVSRKIKSSTKGKYNINPLLIENMDYVDITLNNYKYRNYFVNLVNHFENTVFINNNYLHNSLFDDIIDTIIIDEMNLTNLLIYKNNYANNSPDLIPLKLNHKLEKILKKKFCIG